MPATDLFKACAVSATLNIDHNGVRQMRTSNDGPFKEQYSRFFPLQCHIADILNTSKGFKDTALHLFSKTTQEIVNRNVNFEMHPSLHLSSLLMFLVFKH